MRKFKAYAVMFKFRIWDVRLKVVEHRPLLILDIGQLRLACGWMKIH